jgi:excisionase family DNA binding protein
MALVTIKNLSAFLTVKESTLYSWVHHGVIPFHRLNGLIRFDMEEIEAWVKASRPASTDSIGSLKNKKVPQDIDRIIKKAIDSTEGIRYNMSNGKPGQMQVSERRFNGTV